MQSTKPLHIPAFVTIVSRSFYLLLLHQYAADTVIMKSCVNCTLMVVLAVQIACVCTDSEGPVLAAHCKLQHIQERIHHRAIDHGGIIRSMIVGLLCSVACLLINRVSVESPLMAQAVHSQPCLSRTICLICCNHKRINNLYFIILPGFAI